MATPKTMKAWRLAAFNADVPAAIDSLTLETALPVPGPVGADEVLVKIAYAAINPIDWKIFTGGYQEIAPVIFPFIPGFDIAGEIVQVGANAATSFKVGDTILSNTGLLESCKTPPPTGGPGGALAEYALVPATLCVKTSVKDLSTIVGLSLAGQTSYQALFSGSVPNKSVTGIPLGDTKEGSKVLILGAAGGTGSLAVQLAKSRKAFVACTASSAPMPNNDKQTKMDFVKSLGADLVIDYKTDDWSKVLADKDYDLIYDCVGTPEYLTDMAPKVLKKGGKFVSIANFDVATGSKVEGLEFCPFMVNSNSADLQDMTTMVEKGELFVEIDTVYSLEQAKEALLQSFKGRSVGKIVIKV